MNRIREIRKERGLSGVEVASYLNITPQYLYGFERETRTLSAEMATKLAEYFGVSVDYLLGLTDKVNESKKQIEKENNIPEWATAKDVADFKKMLETEQPVLFDGVPIEGEKRQRVLDILTGLFWEAKELNKETYGRKDRNKKNTSQDDNK